MTVLYNLCPPLRVTRTCPIPSLSQIGKFTFTNWLFCLLFPFSSFPRNLFGERSIYSIRRCSKVNQFCDYTNLTTIKMLTHNTAYISQMHNERRTWSNVVTKRPLQRGYRNWYWHSTRRIHWIPQRWVRSLDGQIPEECGMSLDAVPLLVIVGEVQ